MTTMRRIGYPILCATVAFILSAFSSTPAHSAPQDFQKTLQQAAKRAGSLNNSLLKTKDGSLIPMVKKTEALGNGKYRALVNGAWLTPSSTYKTVTYPGVFENSGTGFDYLFLGQPVPEHLIEGVRKHKGTVKAEKAWIKDAKEMDLTLGIEGNRLLLRARLNYSSVKDSNIDDRMKLLFTASNGVLLWTEYALRDVEKNYQKSLSKDKLTSVNKAAFLRITGDELGEVEQAHDEAKEGYWLFEESGMDFELFNYGDRAELTYYRTIPESIAGQDRENLFSEISKWVSKKKVKNASSQEVVWFDEDILWIKVHFAFDGSITAKDFDKGYWEFKGKFCEGLHKELNKRIQ